MDDARQRLTFVAAVKVKGRDDDLVEKIEEFVPTTRVIVEELTQDKTSGEGGELLELGIQGVICVNQPQDAVLALPSAKRNGLLSDHGFMPLLQSVDHKGHLLRLVTLNPDL
jgi:hypothetical protein